MTYDPRSNHYFPATVVRTVGDDKVLVRLPYPGPESYKKLPNGRLGPAVYPEFEVWIDREFGKNIQMPIDPAAVYVAGDQVCIYSSYMIDSAEEPLADGLWNTRGRYETTASMRYYVIGRYL